MKHPLWIVLLFALLLSACAPAATPEPTVAPTLPPPTETPLPPTFTPEPTATNTELPTETPTITPTPGPVVFTDDFSAENKDAWAGCPKCAWVDGTLHFGPFEPGSNLGESMNLVLCTTCGAHPYYRMAVDITFVDGQVDRYFGVVVGVSPEKLYYLGISPYQWFTIRKYDLKTGYVDGILTKRSGVVRASTLTNRLEVSVKPSSAGNVDIYFNINGKSIYVLSGVPAYDSATGIAMSFHSTTAAYDNFEYEELEAPK